jgi:serine/threonine protein kinase
MNLREGTRLGPYEILSPAGSGGMGEVYRARDTRLGREVAIKVLPPQFASDPDWRRRLDREARAISSLSHPHVCPLFDIGHQEGIDYLVMEYLEGETLAARLARGPLPLEQVLRFGIEIASGLAAAHRQGIVHRDLKPGNVMLTRTGARLLDFGLAKPGGATPAGVAVEATMSGPITERGTLVGTYPYMAPEQVEGREADARSDIFALGTVLYEMAAGKRAFEGQTVASLIAAILERDPVALSTVQPLAPAALDDIIRGCLAKDPDERWQTAHDVKLQLEGLRRRVSTGQSGEAGGLPDVPQARRSRLVIPLAVAALAVAALTAGMAWVRSERPSPATPLVRAFLPPPSAHWFTPNDFQVSPDGRRLAFVAAGPDGSSTLWVSSLESSQSSEIDGTQGAASPFWSSDSRWIGFFANGKLLKAEPGGAGVQEICNATLNAGGGTWSDDDVIVFASSVVGPLFSVRAGGGAPVPVTKIPADMAGEAHRFPQFLPDGQRFLYVASWSNQQRGGVYLGHLDGREPELVSSEIRSRILLVGTEMLYVDRGTLYARPFDTARGRLAGEGKAVLRNEVVSDWRFGDMPLSASRTGMLVYQSRLSYSSQLVWYERSGRELGAVGDPGFSAPRLSPDGRRVAVSYDLEGTGEASTTVFDFQRSMRYLLPRTGTHTAHAWSPDGRWIYYSSLRGANGIYRRRADGSGAEETILESPAHLLVNSHAPKQPRLLFMDFRSGAPELREFDLETRQARSVGPGAEGVYSPDGQWVAHVGTSRGPGLVLTRASGEEGTVQISGAGSQVRWRDDMKEIFYIAPDKKLMSVPLTIKDGTIEPGNPVALFQTRIVQPRLVLFQYDVSKDGQRFLINSLPREDAAAPLTIMVNWTRTVDR